MHPNYRKRQNHFIAGKPCGIRTSVLTQQLLCMSCMGVSNGTSIFNNGFNHKFVAIHLDGHALGLYCKSLLTLFALCLACSDQERFKPITTSPRYVFSKCYFMYSIVVQCILSYVQWDFSYVLLLNFCKLNVIFPTHIAKVFRSH